MNSIRDIKKANSSNHPPQPSGEEGIALVMTIFVISLATILVLDFANTAHFDQRIARHFSESIQGNYMLKSTVSFGQVFLEVPKNPEDQDADGFTQPWHSISSVPSLEIDEFAGDVRMAIYDEDSKIDINSLHGATRGSVGGGGGNPMGAGGNGAPQTPRDPAIFWKNAIKEIFIRGGFYPEGYEKDKFVTRGNEAFGPEKQVAVIQDWIDADSDAYQSSADFPESGIESGSNKELFFNRRLRSLSELLLVPGFTPERLARIAPHIKVPPQFGFSRQVNVNTATPEVLRAVGLSESDISEILEQRTSNLYNRTLLGAVFERSQASAELRSRLKFQSNQFSVIAKVQMPASSRWIRAVISAQRSGPNRRRTTVTHTELY